MVDNDLRPISEILPQDIVVCGFPRSGHTWFQNLLAGVVFGIDPELAHDSLIQDLVPDVHYKRWYKRYGPTAFFKSHALPHREYRRIVYLLRDGRDVMVSYYHFLSALQGRVDFLKLVQTERWHDHVERWHANPHGAEILVVRYEDLQTSPVEQLRRFCVYAGLQREDSHLERIANQAAFAKAQAKERTQGWDNQAWPRDKPFIRRGQVGNWRDEMPSAVLDAFLKIAEPTLQRFGYV